MGRRTYARPPAPPSRAATRIFEVLVTAAVLVFFAPLMVLIAAAIFAESGRPIFFSQVRLGRGGRQFRHAQVPQIPQARVFEPDSR